MCIRDRFKLLSQLCIFHADDGRAAMRTVKRLFALAKICDDLFHLFHRQGTIKADGAVAGHGRDRMFPQRSDVDLLVSLPDVDHIHQKGALIHLLHPQRQGTADQRLFTKCLKACLLYTSRCV